MEKSECSYSRQLLNMQMTELCVCAQNIFFYKYLPEIMKFWESHLSLLQLCSTNKLTCRKQMDEPVFIWYMSSQCVNNRIHHIICGWIGVEDGGAYLLWMKSSICVQKLHVNTVSELLIHLLRIHQL